MTKARFEKRLKSFEDFLRKADYPYMVIIVVRESERKELVCTANSAPDRKKTIKLFEKGTRRVVRILRKAHLETN